MGVREQSRWADRDSRLALTSSSRANQLWWRAFYLVWAGRLKEAEGALGKCERTAVLKYDRGLLAQADWLRGWVAFERRDWKKARLHLSDYAMLARSPGAAHPWFSEFCLGLLIFRMECWILSICACSGNPAELDTNRMEVSTP
jgi:hypothetical protein